MLKKKYTKKILKGSIFSTVKSQRHEKRAPKLSGSVMMEGTKIPATISSEKRAASQLEQ